MESPGVKSDGFVSGVTPWRKSENMAKPGGLEDRQPRMKCGVRRRRIEPNAGGVEHH